MNQSVHRWPVSFPYLLTARSVITAVFFIAIIPLAVATRHQIHQHFSKESLQEVFHVENHEDVPEYELVHVRTVVKRDAEEGEGKKKSAHVTAFGKRYHLNLERNPHLVKNPRHLKVLAAKVKDGRVHLDEINSENKTVIDEVGEPYHDLANEAAVTILHDPKGGLRMQGTIGKWLVIKPVPLVAKEEIQKIIATTADDEMFLDDEYPYKPLPSTEDTVNNSLVDSSHSESEGIHVVYRRKEAEQEGGSDYLFMEPDRLPLPIRPRRSIRKREAPETIWPEVLVIADFDTFNMHGANSVNIKRYFVSFWNGVDLRYKLLVGPKVRVSLAGIIISKGRDATPYLENNRVKGDAVDSAAALTDMGKYLFRERRLPTYDLAVVVTKLDVCRRQPSGTCSKGTAGFAYVGGACVVNSRLEKVNSVAIVEDTGGFSGIIVAAHEVGHLLGAVHDGSPAPSYLGGPGAEHCRWEDGFIMSDLRHTERGFQWSSCSIDQFRHFLNSDTATCLHNVPHEDEELPRILPGKMLSLDAQCRKDRGTSACFKDDRVCAQLFCFDSKSGYCVSYRPAAEGSPCGDGQHCISGKCVTEHDNYIPDFTKITEVVVDKPETAATVIRPLVSKPDERTTPEDKDDDVIPETTPTTTASSRRSKFRYNTVFRKATTTSASTVSLPTSKDGDVIRHNNIGDSDAICDDVMETLAGGLTCKQFLRNYRPRYCSHPYIMTNCCASRKLMCDE